MNINHHGQAKRATDTLVAAPDNLDGGALPLRMQLEDIVLLGEDEYFIYLHEGLLGELALALVVGEPANLR
jgi:hypothetical protein